MATLAALAKGHAFSPTTFDLTLEWVDAYVAAVEDGAIQVLGGDYVPPMAVAALAVRALLEQASLPPGTLHAAQELTFSASACVGDTLTAEAQVLSQGERQGSVLMSIGLNVGRPGEAVMTGRATVAFPADGASR